MAQTAKSFFRGAMDALIEARTRQANAYVQNALRAMDDRTLKAYGYSRKDLQNLGR